MPLWTFNANIYFYIFIIPPIFFLHFFIGNTVITFSIRCASNLFKDKNHHRLQRPNLYLYVCIKIIYIHMYAYMHALTHLYVCKMRGDELWLIPLPIWLHLIVKRHSSFCIRLITGGFFVFYPKIFYIDSVRKNTVFLYSYLISTTCLVLFFTSINILSGLELNLSSVLNFLWSIVYSTHSNWWTCYPLHRYLHVVELFFLSLSSIWSSL